MFFSIYAWVAPLKDRKAITNAFQRVLDASNLSENK